MNAPDEHMSGDIECFCGEILENRESLMLHLTEEHCMEKLPFTKPVIEINAINVTLDKKYTYNARLGDTELIILIKCKSESKKLLISIVNVGDIFENTTFTLKSGKNRDNLIKGGKIVKSFLRSKKAIEYHFPKFDKKFLYNTKIYFENYENFEPLETTYQAMRNRNICSQWKCPNTIIRSCYQCDNGHNICTNCKNHNTKCVAPDCKEQINEQCIDTRSWTANIQTLCKYLLNGCLIHGSLQHMEKHESSCNYRDLVSIQCEGCGRRSFRKEEYIHHMKSFYNMKMLNPGYTHVKPGYVFSENAVLEFTASQNYKENEMNISWNLSIKHSFDQTTAYDYNICIKVLDQEETLVKKTERSGQSYRFNFLNVYKDIPAIFHIKINPRLKYSNNLQPKTKKARLDTNSKSNLF